MIDWTVCRLVIREGLLSLRSLTPATTAAPELR